ncbi:MAG: tol-pal system protein YbgF [Pseudomonadota bacterium]
MNGSHLLKAAVSVLFLWATVVVSGCAMREDVLILNQKIDAMTTRTTQIHKEMDNLQAQLEKVRQDIKSIDTVKTVEVMTKKQADMGLQLDEIRAEMMKLQGSMEEHAHQIENIKAQDDIHVASIQEQANRLQELAARSEKEDKNASQVLKLSEQLNDLQSKLTGMENRLALLEAAGPERSAPKTDEAVKEKPDAPTEQKTAPANRTAKEDYDEAYELFKKNELVACRDKFEAFLKKHPKSELAGNAQYWLAESYFQQDRYEEAILEYEKVLSDHKGPKVPSALLKQGLAFHQLGDKKTAGYLLEKLIKEYPKSEQALSARTTLKKWGAKQQER